jgi:class 3 adenylate cyclase
VAGITDRADPGRVLVSNVVREPCAGKQFEFESLGEAALKGFDEPLAPSELRGDRRARGESGEAED